MTAIDQVHIPLQFHKISVFLAENLSMTAESHHESDTKSDLSMIDELTRDYSRYLEVDASKQVICFSCLTKFRIVLLFGNRSGILICCEFTENSVT